MNIKSQLEDIQKKNSAAKSQVDQTVHNIDSLIQRVREIEFRIQDNEKQPLSAYEKLLLDCQVCHS